MSQGTHHLEMHRFFYNEKVIETHRYLLGQIRFSDDFTIEEKRCLKLRMRIDENKKINKNKTITFIATIW